MKVLIAGRSGQLATELARARWPEGTELTLKGRPELDVADETSVASNVRKADPDLIINAAAYTFVDRAEEERELAFAVNRDGPRYLAQQAEHRGIPIVHVSTDYVFSGRSERPWREEDPAAPASVYGLSKLEGERAIRAATARHAIMRSSWVFASHGANFVRTMLRLGRTQETLRIVDDQIGCPTPAADLARAMIEISARAARRDLPFGTYHYCGKGAVSWFGFAQAIFALAADLLPRRPALEPIATTEFDAAVPRPAYSVLDCTKLGAELGVRQRPWREGLVEVLKEIRSETP